MYYASGISTYFDGDGQLVHDTAHGERQDLIAFTLSIAEASCRYGVSVDALARHVKGKPCWRPSPRSPRY